MTDEWGDPSTDDDGPWENPITRGLMQIVMGTLVFVLIGTLVFDDPLRASVVQGLLFGVAYAVLYAVYQYVR